MAHLFRYSAFRQPTRANMWGWWMADAGVTLSGSSVTAWADQSGNGDSNRNFVQATGANQPTYNSSDASFNGRPSIQSDGSNDWMAFSGNASSNLGNTSTIYAAFTMSSSSSVVLFDGTTSVTRQLMYRTSGGAWDLIQGTNASFAEVTILTANTAMHILVASFFGSADFAKGNVDNATVGNGAPTGTKTNCSPTALTIFDRYAHDGFAWNGKLAELIAYSGVNHDRTTIGANISYLGLKYGKAVTL